MTTAKVLLPHQIEDAAFLASKSFAGNFSGMGSGKTLTALEAYNKVVNRLNANGPHVLLIVGPPISLTMWKDEFEEFFTASIAQIVKTGKVPLDDTADAYIMSYEIATKRVAELKALGAKVLICDESHALKTPTAKRTHAILGAGGLCESVDHAWMLSGTPSTKYNDDLYSFLARADEEGLKQRIGGTTLERFQLRYCVTQKRRFSKYQRVPTIVTVGNRNTEELNAMLFDGGLAVRRELADVWAQMPPITINRLQVALDADAELKQRLKAMENQTLTQIQKDLAAKEEHLATTRRLLGEAKVKHSVKEIIDRVEAGIKPILVGAWHTNVIDALKAALLTKGLDVGVIDGRTGPAARTAYIECFNGGGLDVLVGQLGAMGVSLNLQGGSHIIVVEEDFSPAVMDQFYARCHRIGQADHVHVDIFESDTQLDKAIRRIVANKRRGHDTLMDQGDET